MAYIEFSENNSGGEWWLSADQYEKLKAAGWEGEGVIPGDRYGGRRMIRRGLSRKMAIAEWEDVTGEDAYTQGCECCGAPYGFYEYDDAGNMVW